MNLIQEHNLLFLKQIVYFFYILCLLRFRRIYLVYLKSFINPYHSVTVILITYLPSLRMINICSDKELNY